MRRDQNIYDISATGRVAPALLCEMMRSFTGLARTLNLSQAVEELGSTRQTVRRHVSQLEAAMGFKLFEVEQRRYRLTVEGERALEPAQLLLELGSIWYAGEFQHVDGMLRFSVSGGNGWSYSQQQLPIGVAWECDSELLRAALKAWTASEGRLESRHMAQIRPYVLAYRKNADVWICTEVGESSFYSNWYGWAQARSSVGRNLSEFQGGQEFASLADRPFSDVSATQGVRIDQIMITTERDADGKQDCVVIDRLLMGVRMPDNSPALVSVVDRACRMRIEGGNADAIAGIPDRAKVDFAAQ